MKSVFQALARLLSPTTDQRRASTGLIDSLLQTFENCRPGLSDETIATSKEKTAQFFLNLYEKEQPRLIDMMQVQEGFLPKEIQKKLFNEADALIRNVVIPAYVRHAVSFTPRERNDFYLTPSHLHFLERFGWTVGGMLLGGFIVWAPFIPLWSKEWVLPFTILGLIFPNLRKIYSIKRYESELNRIVAKAESEMDRIELEYTSAQMLTGRQQEERDVMGAPEPLDADHKKSRETPERIKQKGGD